MSVDLSGLDQEGAFDQEGAYYRLMLESFGIQRLPTAVWHPVPPGVTGLKAILRTAKAGSPVDRWFTPSRFGPSVGGVRGRSVVAITLAAAKLSGLPAPWPEHLPPADPEPVARWLAATLRQSTGAVIHCSSSAAVLVCDVALRELVSLEGAFFVLAGEPLTPASHSRIGFTGARAANLYSMSEVGYVGIPCADAADCDEVHVLDRKLAVHRRPLRLDAGQSADSLDLTSLSSATSKFLLNVETGDEASSARRQCGCLFGSLGFEQHLWDIRSYEKLTCEGMTFTAADLLRLLEETLPRRFGGSPSDYQLVEQDGTRGTGCG